MSCVSCGSGNQTEFSAEINIHFPGLKNLDKRSVLVFPKLLVCLDSALRSLRFQKPSCDTSPSILLRIQRLLNSPASL